MVTSETLSLLYMTTALTTSKSCKSFVFNSMLPVIVTPVGNCCLCYTNQAPEWHINTQQGIGKLIERKTELLVTPKRGKKNPVCLDL